MLRSGSRDRETNMKSDSQLKQDVLAELKWQPSIDAARIGVEVDDGVVTLRGHVGSFAEKWYAERAAQRVAGVHALAVAIEVALPGSVRRTDTDIAGAADNALEWISDLRTDHIKVLVEGGRITLTGAVAWDYQRREAESAVRHLAGVTGVTNDIMVEPQGASEVQEEDIESALNRRAIADPSRISVEVSGAEVTLSGTVNSWFERDLARDAAWAAIGVRNVVDEMKVAH